MNDTAPDTAAQKKLLSSLVGIAVCFLLTALAAYFFIESQELRSSARRGPLLFSGITLTLLIVVLMQEIFRMIKLLKSERWSIKLEIKDPKLIVKVPLLITWVISTTFMMGHFHFLYSVIPMLFILFYPISRLKLVTSIWATVLSGVFLYLLFILVLKIN